MSIEAMKQALEALETLNSGDSYKTHNAATVLRQAIAEAEKLWVKTYAGGKPNYTTPEKQEPVPNDYDKSIHSNPDAQAWAKFFIDTLAEQSWRIEDIDEGLMIGWFANAMMAMHDHVKREWVGLTTDEMKEVADRYHLKPPNVPVAFRAIEAKLKEKNT